MSEKIEGNVESVRARPPARRRTRGARAVTEIRSIARSHTRTAINVLVGIMRNADATPAARVSAANAILDRGWGRPLLAVANEDGSPVEFIQHIERIIVHPDMPGHEPIVIDGQAERHD